MAGMFTLAGAVIAAVAALAAILVRKSLDRKSLAAALLAEVELLLTALANDKGT